ncbi:MAG: restriction endonuclease subunit S [Myxococcales bacterium]|nr:restriction endonuclease subunit S [Myxococcales bacterium]
MSTQTSLFGESEPERKKSKVPPKIEEVVGEGFDVQRLVENFEPIADAAGSVEVLRAFVLRLALRGRLSDGSLNAQTGLPDDWSWFRLDEASTWAGGSGFPTQAQGHTDRPFLFCKVSDMNLPGNERFIVTTANTIDAETAKRVRAKLHPAGTVIFPKIGGAIATNKRRVLTRPGAIDNNCLGVIPNGRCSSEFLLLVMRDIDLTEYQNDGPVPALNQGRIGAIEVAVAPLAEQKRIVAKVDELMALIDDLEAKQTKKREVGARLTKSALDALTSAEGPEEFDAAWKRVMENFDVLIDRAEKVGEVRDTVLALAVTGKLSAPATTWSSLPLASVAESRLGKMLDKAKNRGAAVPYLRTTNVHWFRLELGDIKLMPFEKHELGEYELRRNDLLVCEGGHGIGRTAVWNGEREPMMFQKALHRLRPVPSMNSIFLAYQLKVAADTGLMATFFTGAGIPHLTGRKLAQMPVIVPPRSEQDRLVERVEALMRICDQLEAKLRVAEERAAKVAEAAVRELVA